MDKKFTIITDGAAKGNPGPGGWGAIVAFGEEVVELGGKEEHTTNNRMELLGVIEALKFAHAKKAKDLEVYSDSGYVLNGISKWIHGWKKKGWVTSTKKSVLNQDLWKELDHFAHGSDLKIVWKQVKGHVGLLGNERADVVASSFAEGKNPKLYQGPFSAYGINIFDTNPDQAKLASKSAFKARSKQRAYSYVSKLDGVVKIHKTWAECEARVKGKPARFKKAASPEDEKKIADEFSLPNI